MEEPEMKVLGLRIDPTVSVGNIIILLGGVITAFTMMSELKSSISFEKERRQSLEARVAEDRAATADSLRQIRQSVEKSEERLMFEIRQLSQKLDKKMDKP